MITYEQIQQDIQTLPPEALELLAQFIQLLKQSQPDTEASDKTSEQLADWSDFIGCIEAEADLSVNYKAYLAQGLEQPHGVDC